MALARIACLALLLAVPAAPAAAQQLPEGPISFGGGRIVIAGDLSAAFGADDPAYFTFGEYEHSTLRQLRVSLTGEVRASRRLSLLAELRSDNLRDVSPSALYLRFRPFPDQRLDVQAGRIPPTFGRFSRQAYSRDNVLIGSPLAFQYLTSLRPDALPADADELLRMRGRGWQSGFTIGNPAPAAGVPLADGLHWDTGVQVTGAWRALALTGSVTNGTLANPRVSDDNSGKQAATRVVLTAAPGLELGHSFSRGAFVARSALGAVAGMPGGSLTQRAHGVDAELARGHWLARAEALFSEWSIPLAAAGRVESLRAAAVSAEARYAFRPGLHGAVRAEHLAFSRIAGARQTLPWDAPVTRVETGVSYYLQRNVIVRTSLQFNHREDGRTPDAWLPAAQLLFWF